MKTLFSAFILLSIFCYSCKDDDQCDEAPSYTKCQEKPDTGVTCTAYFQTWIYNESAGECELIGFSGCEPKGFAEKAECDKCDCNRLENFDD